MTLGYGERVTLLFVFIFFSLSAFSNEAIEVVDKTLKLGGLEEKSFFYSFAEGDEILFTFKETKGKTLKEIEVRRDGGNIRFSEFKVNEINNRVIKVQHTGVFEFRFNNGSVSGRICSIQIQRRPGNELTKNFNTGWKWKTLFDTSYYLVNVDSISGYDTTYRPYSVKEVLNVDTNYFDFAKTEKVHTLLNSNGDRSIVEFDLPRQYKNLMEERLLIGWAYWFGTEGVSPPEIENRLQTASLAASISPLAGFAMGIWAINKSVGGHNLNYGILDGPENAYYYRRKETSLGFDWGDGSSSSKQHIDWYPNTFYIGFDNDHTYPVNVDIKVSVVMSTTTYHNVQYKEEIVTPRIVILEKKRMKVTESKIRVPEE